MSVIILKNITCRYPYSDKNIFENFSVTLDTNWKLALTGRNGRGKTTLLRLLGGELHEYTGTIQTSAEYSYFPYRLKTGCDTLSALYTAIPNMEIWSLKKEMSRLRLREKALEIPMECLSEGEKTKLLLAALFSSENAFPLIDEPTNHLDEHGRHILGEYLREKQGFILVSHDRTFLDSCCDHVLALNHDGYELRKGRFSDWWNDKCAADVAEAEKSERLKKEIYALQKSAERTNSWADKVEASKNRKVSGLKPDKGHIGAMAAKMAKRAKACERRKENAIAEKASLLKNAEFYGNLKFNPLNFRAETLASLTGGNKKYGTLTAIENFTLSVKRGNRIALCGDNGCGKSTVLKIFAGKFLPDGGIFARPGDLIVSYLPQDLHGLCGTLTKYAEENGASPSLVMAILNKLNFRSELFSEDMRGYSDGQKKKAALAVSLARPAHLYVWDEPLNYIDLVSRIQLEELILKAEPTMLFVEHDAAFRKKVATQTIFM